MFYLGFARGRVKRCFPISNIYTINTTLLRATCCPPAMSLAGLFSRRYSSATNNSRPSVVYAYLVLRQELCFRHQRFFSTHLLVRWFFICITHIWRMLHRTLKCVTDLYYSYKNVMPCGLASKYWYFRGSSCLHHLSWRVRQTVPLNIPTHCSEYPNLKYACNYAYMDVKCEY